MRRRLASTVSARRYRSPPHPKITVEADCSWRKISEEVASHGRTCLVIVDDGSPGRADRCLFELRKVGINCATFTGRGVYPTADAIDEARELAKRIGAASIVGIGGGGVIDTAKATARLHTSSGGSKHFLTSPGGLLLGEGSSTSSSGPRTPAGDALPLVSVPTSTGSGAAANARCLVWHPDDEVLVPLAESPGKDGSSSVTLVDPTLCASLSQAQTAAMALTALSACVDALLARELGSAAGTAAPQDEDMLLRLGSRGIGAVAEGLPVALADGKDTLARELLAVGGVCAGQLSAITPAPPAQLMARAAGSLLGRHSYSSVCAMVFPHVVTDMLNQANSFTGDAQVSEAIERALSLSATLLLGDGSDGQALLSWLETQQRECLDFDSLSSVDSTITAKDVMTNAEMLLAIEEDSEAADRIWSGSGVLGVCELVVG